MDTCPSSLCIRSEYTKENLSAKGGYIISQSNNSPDINLIASGSEVSIAIEAKELLKKNRVSANVVSMPCLEIFEEQNEEYRQNVLDPEVPVVIIEAAVEQSWGRYLGREGKFVGMKSFGASAPSNMLFEHFKITAEKVLAAVEEINL